MAMSPEATKALVMDLLQRVLRSWWTVVAGVCLGAAVSTLALDHIPKIYEANSSIFVAPQKIPDMRLMLQDDMGLRLNALESEVKSSSYMKNLIEELDANIPEYVAPQNEDEMERTIRKMQRDVKVNVRRSARMFTINYQHEVPVVAAEVVNTLAQLYIQENVDYREKRTEETKEVWQRLADDTWSQLKIKEEAISAFKSNRLYSLNQSFQGNVKQLENRERQLETLLASETRARDQLQLLETQREQALQNPDAPTFIPGSAAVDPATARLATLRSELDQLKLRYSENHPTVTAKKRELDEFLATYSPSSTSGEPTGDGTPSVASQLAPINAQIDAQKREINRIVGDINNVRAEISSLERRIEATPKNELELAELSKGLEILRQQHQGYLAQVEKARSASLAESQRQGEQFEIIERASVPRVPVQPQPTMIIGMGVVIGLIVFVSPVILKRFLQPVINSESALVDFADTPIVFSIPRIPTPEGMRLEHWRRVRNFAFSAVALLILAGVVAFTYADGKILEMIG